MAIETPALSKPAEVGFASVILYHVLITNIGYAWKSGTEVVVRDLAAGLVSRGRRVTIFSNTLGGDFVESSRQAGVAVVDQLDAITDPPDLIHAHHVLPSAEAFLRFPHAPAVMACHGSLAWHDEPLMFPQVLRYIAVDLACYERLISAGIAPERVLTLYNAVDLKRIPPRPLPLSERPMRVAAFGKAAVLAPMLNELCIANGYTFEVIGGHSGTSTPENELVGFDLIFATARAAIEALACGCAVVLADGRGCGGMVTNNDYARLRANNFGLRILTNPSSLVELAKAILAYDPADAAKISARVREDADLERLLDGVTSVHDEVLAERHLFTGDATEQVLPMERLLRQLTPHDAVCAWPWQAERDQLMETISALELKLYNRNN